MPVTGRSFPAAALVLILIATACGGDADQAPQTPGGTPAEGAQGAPGSGRNLADVCPNPIVIQNSWVPQSTEGHAYAMIQLDQAEHDPSTQAVAGPAVADPRVTIEIRAGGPAIGFQNVTSILYSNPETLLVVDSMDEMIATSGDFPTVAVFAPYKRHPRALIYGEEAFSQGIDSFEDIKESGAPVLVAEGQVFARALVGLGALDEDQLDFSFDFSPVRFLTADGRLFQTAFGNVTEHDYETSLEEWGGRPIGTIFAEDGGYPNYRVLYTRPDAIEEHTDCLRELVPAMQEAWVSYLDDPIDLNRAIFEWNEAANQYTYSVETFDASVDINFQFDLVGDGPSGYLGEMTEERVQTLLDLVLPVFQEQGATVNSDLTAKDLYTNEFLDQSISLPAR